jgi:Fic family protein
MLFTTPDLDERELQVLSEVDELKRRLRHQLHEPRRWYGSLRRLSIARAIQGSNSIEGFDATLDDAAAVAVGEEPLDSDSETRLALKGYREAMTYVLQLADDDGFAYSSQLIKSLHFMMTSYDLRNRPAGGALALSMCAKKRRARSSTRAPTSIGYPASRMNL